MDALAGYGSSDDEGSTKSEQTSDNEEDKLLQVEVGGTKVFEIRKIILNFLEIIILE